MKTKTAIAVSTTALSVFAVFADTQVYKNKDPNHEWSYGGLVAGISTCMIAVGALIKSEEGTNWWSQWGWYTVTTIATATAIGAGMVAFARNMGEIGGKIGRKTCITGCPCGNACIDCSKTCHKY